MHWHWHSCADPPSAGSLRLLWDLWSNSNTFSAKWWMKKITLQVLQVPTQNFTVTLFQLYVKDDFNIASVMQGLPALQNHCCKNLPFHFAKLCEIKIKFFFQRFSLLLLHHYSSSARSDSLVLTSKSHFAPSSAVKRKRNKPELRKHFCLLWFGFPPSGRKNE